jgi:hypothetical protein
MRGPNIDPRRIRILMGFQREGPLSGGLYNEGRGYGRRTLLRHKP